MSTSEPNTPYQDVEAQRLPRHIIPRKWEDLWIVPSHSSIVSCSDDSATSSDQWETVSTGSDTIARNIDDQLPIVERSVNEQRPESTAQNAAQNVAQCDNTNHLIPSLIAWVAAAFLRTHLTTHAIYALCTSKLLRSMLIALECASFIAFCLSILFLAWPILCHKDRVNGARQPFIIWLVSVFAIFFVAFCSSFDVADYSKTQKLSQS